MNEKLRKVHDRERALGAEPSAPPTNLHLVPQKVPARALADRATDPEPETERKRTLVVPFQDKRGQAG